MNNQYKPLTPTVSKTPAPKPLSGGMDGGYTSSSANMTKSTFWGAQRPPNDTLASRKRATPTGTAASTQNTWKKTASTELKPYQQRVVNKVTNPNGPHGIIAYHSMGSGKTLTSLGALDVALKQSPKAKGLVVVPASLVNNYNEEIDKHGFKNLKRKIDIISYDRAANHADELKKKHYALAVFDEAHRLRNTDTHRTKQLRQVIDKANKVLLLTGTAAYNNPVDMCNLINTANPGVKLPTTQTDFNKRFIDDKTWKIRNKTELAKLLTPYVDHYETPRSSGDFPSVERKVINVEMSPRQAAVYKAVEKDIPKDIRKNIEGNMPLTVQQASRLNVFSQGVRQVADSTLHHDDRGSYKDSPKIMAAVGSMLSKAKTKPGFRGVVYSNYLDAGLKPYAQALQDAGIEPLVYTGKLSKNEKQELIDKYNSKSKKPQVLLLSSSGSEGLNLKNTRLMQILEPHFNKSKTDQAEARAIRYKSHEALPENERNVIVEEYRSTLPKTTFQKWLNRPATTAIDNYLAQVGDKKQSIVKEINSLLD